MRWGEGTGGERGFVLDVEQGRKARLVGYLYV